MYQRDFLEPDAQVAVLASAVPAGQAQTVTAKIAPHHLTKE